MSVGAYNNMCVLLSILISVLTSYSAINMAGKVIVSRRLSSKLWFVGASFVMGAGIWSAHLAGMLAFHLSNELSYDLLLASLSLVTAIVSSAVAFWLVSLKDASLSRFLFGAFILGGGIATMHYIGVAALFMSPDIDYISLLFALSIFIPVAASGTALWIGFHRGRGGVSIKRARISASLMMGCATVGMHYTGIAAARLPDGSVYDGLNRGFDNELLLALVVLTSLGVCTIALIVSMQDVCNALLVNSLKLAKSELVRQALHDSLTRLPNRRLFNDRLERAIREATCRNGGFSLMFMDLDGFKAVNDTYGHHIGDLLLVEVANRINEVKRTQDTVARVGGDEFVLLFAPGEPNDVISLAEDLVKNIRIPYIIGQEILNVSVSIGIAKFPADGLTEHELMINADAAMYHAKKNPREGYCFFEKAMNVTSRQQLKLLLSLRRALDNNEFVLFFQPKVLAPCGPILGVEALLRWNKPDVGLILPEHFLPLAERTGLITPIGNWLINEACRQMADWHFECKGEWSIAVNLSTVQLSDASVVDIVSSALEINGLAPQFLTLEVTESAAMRDAESSVLILDQLAMLGVSISIDDFGTGYSSLVYLKRLPATELKIDRGFVSELAKGNEDAAIVAAIVALGKTLDLSVVAEGVETLEQQELLTDLGCDVLQGYLLGKPMNAEKMLETLRASVTSP